MTGKAATDWLRAVVKRKAAWAGIELRMIGNSVFPPLAAVLVKANFAHEHQIVRAA